jgi:hypothetical protein
MDIGSFVLDSDGVRWAHDLGAEGYHGIESRGMNLWGHAQDSDRWTIFRQSNHGHNTLAIDDQLQRAAARAEIVDFSDRPAEAYSLLDMSKLYEGQAKSVRRRVTLFPSREVLIEDRLTGLKAGSCVRWGMITTGTPGAAGTPKIELCQGEARLALRIVAPAACGWKIVETATPRREWDSPNPGTCMAAFEATAPESGALALSVLATPGSATQTVADRLGRRE